MDELAKQLHILRDEVEPEWDEARSERLLAGVDALRWRRQRQRVLFGAVGAACAAVAVGVLLRGSVHGSAPSVASRPGAIASAIATAPNPAVAPSRSMRVGAGQRLWLSDGSLVQVAAGEGVLEVLHDEKMQIDLRLVSGTAHFQVVPNKQRHFVVDAGAVKVAVVGTVFDVEHAGELVGVTVTEGKVRVQGGSGESFVAGGDARWFDAAGHETQHEVQHETQGVHAVDDARGENDALRPVPESEQHGVAPAVKHRAARRESSAKASWRSLTQVGEYDEAYRSLAQGAAVDDDPAVLMDAADASRLSGHPEMAATYLRRVVREHKQSPVAPLAAFTLGRVLLERLGQPSEAAESFATARGLAPQGSLAQDALAREVEALSKAGNAHEAYLRARAYVQSYPNGRRLHAVQLYGGLSRE